MGEGFELVELNRAEIEGLSRSGAAHCNAPQAPLQQALSPPQTAPPPLCHAPPTCALALLGRRRRQRGQQAGRRPRRQLLCRHERLVVLALGAVDAGHVHVLAHHVVSALRDGDAAAAGGTTVGNAPEASVQTGCSWERLGHLGRVQSNRCCLSSNPDLVCVGGEGAPLCLPKAADRGPS